MARGRGTRIGVEIECSVEIRIEHGLRIKSGTRRKRGTKKWLGGMEFELAWNSNWCELELSVELE